MKGGPAVQPKYATVTEMLAASAQSGVSLVFVNRREEDHEVSMAAIRERALSISADLKDRGVRKGDRVALVLPTSPEFVQCFFGVLCAGAIPVPLYPPVRLGRLDEYHQKTAAMLRAVGATLVITDERIRRLLGVAVETARPRLGAVVVSALSGTNPLEIEVSADDVALIQFSSGTTHDPKPVALTHANLLSNLAAISQEIISEDGAPVGRCHVAAAVPRHGIDRQSALRVLRSRPPGAASARAVRRGTRCVASRNLTTPRHALGGTQLRLRPVSQANPRRRARWRRPSHRGKSASTARRWSAQRGSGDSLSDSGAGVCVRRRSHRATGWRRPRWP